MYVRKREFPSKFPPNYGGNLSAKEYTEEKRKIKELHTYKLRKNTYCKKKHDNRAENNHDLLLNSFSGDELLLLGLLVFLYVGCEHSKENLILMGAVAYLLFAQN